MADALRLQSVSYIIDGATLIAGADLAVAAGTFLGIIGPNGAGKSTLLRLAAGLIAPTTGAITLDGAPLATLSRRRIAQLVGYVPQQSRLDFPFSVEDVVMDGRNPHIGRFQTAGADDLLIVRDAMVYAGILSFAERNVQTLSGGEQQRVLIARALAQQPRILLLDEPTANLDLHHQHAVLRLTQQLAREQGLAVIAAIHDVELAARYCDALIALAGGHIVASGPPREVVTPALLEQVFHVQADVTPDPRIADAVRLTIFGPSDDDEDPVLFEATTHVERRVERRG